MGRYITTKADFTLRRKHKKYSGATIYENDYTTINPMPNALKGEYVIGDSNFVFTSRLGINGQKKHVRGKFVPNPSGTTEEGGAWTIDTIIDSGITNETRIRLKPNYTSIRDFACYGSAVKLIQGTINGVIMDFPAEMWLSNSQIAFYGPDDGKAGYSTNDTNAEYYKLCGNTYTLIESEEDMDAMYSDTAATIVTATSLPIEITDDSPSYVKVVAILENLLYNEYAIDITTKNIQETSVYNPLRYFALCGSSYNLLVVDEDGKETEYPFIGYDVKNVALGECYGGKDVEVDKLAEIKLNFSGITVCVNEYKDYTDGSVYYTYSDCGKPEPPAPDPEPPEQIITIYGDFEQLPYEEVLNSVQPTEETDEIRKTNGKRVKKAPIILGAGDVINLSGAHIRPKKEIVEEYFRTCDDFTYVLLDRMSKPIYTAIFETPKEVETGYIYDMVSYTWPSLLGGYNPDLSGPYYSYVESLIALAEYYDEFHCDNMWRSLTHEAIKTLDLTYVSNSDGDIQDMSTIDTSRIEPITKIYGRQFDDLKRYADAIKSINTITYNQKSNTPDYTLTDVLENTGWETKTLKLTDDNKLYTKTLYSGLTSGYTSSDANNEFLRRLKLNSQYLFSAKGTRKGLDAMLSMFGFTPDEYKIREYVYVFSATTSQFPHFCNDTDGKSFAYPLAKDVATVNKYKINFNSFDPYGEYCGIPVTEVGYWKDGEDYSYVVPWYSQDKTYDNGLYFQMHGGWGKRKKMDIDLEIAPSITQITGTDAVPLYMETQARLKFAKDFDELLQEAFASSNTNDVFYVTDISNIEDMYSGDTAGKNNASHYFVLDNVELNQFLGYSSELGKYGWRSIQKNEIVNNTTSAGTLVLYLESIKDDTTGNNPHIGNGAYDDGLAYVSGMSEIFAWSLVNKNFIGIDDGTCSKIKKFVFDRVRQEDNRKCWFFTDDYNFRYGKNVKYLTQDGKPAKESDCGNPWSAGSETIVFKEVDVSDKICAIKRCHDRSSEKRIIDGDDSIENCTKDLDYDVFKMLSTADDNGLSAVGVSADDDLQIAKELDDNGNPITVIYRDVYNRITSLKPFDPENRVGPDGEAAANSVVNVKNLVIEFTSPEKLKVTDDFDGKKEFRKYIETSVIPYLTQMLPSTSILSWTFDGE